MNPARRTVALVVAAALLFVLSLALAGIGVPGYSHRLHPLALRAAAGLPWAAGFGLLAFVLPAACLLWASLRARDRLERPGWPARIGLVLAQLSALAYGAQGLLAMQLQDPDATANRLHALAWMLWWIAFVPAALLLGAGARRGAGFAFASVLAGLLLPVLTVLAPVGPWAGLAQRLAFALWFGWWLLAARALGRPPRVAADAALR